MPGLAATRFCSTQVPQLQAVEILPRFEGYQVCHLSGWQRPGLTVNQKSSPRILSVMLAVRCWVQQLLTFSVCGKFRMSRVVKKVGKAQNIGRNAIGLLDSFKVIRGQ